MFETQLYKYNSVKSFGWDATYNQSNTNTSQVRL